MRLLIASQLQQACHQRRKLRHMQYLLPCQTLTIRFCTVVWLQPGPWHCSSDVVV